MGDLLKPVTDLVGLTGDDNAGAASAAASAANIQKAVDEIKNLELPDIEKEKLELQLLSEAGFLGAEQLGPSALEDISIDPRTREAQMQALMGIQERAEMGMTPEDRAVLDQFMDTNAQRAQAEQAGILQGMAERGTLDSGAQLAAQLASQQGGANRGQDAAMQMGAGNFEARQAAIARLGNLGTSMADQDFSQQARVGSAQDSINEFNTRLRQDTAKTNLGIRQSDVDTRNEQQRFNKGLIDRDFNRRNTKASNVAGALSGQAQQQQQQAQAEAQAEQSKRAGRFSAFTGVAGAALGNPVIAKKLFE